MKSLSAIAVAFVFGLVGIGTLNTAIVRTVEAQFASSYMATSYVAINTNASVVDADIVAPRQKVKTTSPSAVCRKFNFDTTLQAGSSGEAVQELQKVLIEEKVLDQGNDTGYYGPATEAAVRNWQAKKGLQTAGIVGPQTRGLLNAYNRVCLKEGKGEVKDESTLQVIAPKAGAVWYQGSDQRVAWKSFKGDFDYQEVMLGNKLVPGHLSNLWPLGTQSSSVSAKANSMTVDGRDLSDNMISAWMSNSNNKINERDLRKNFFIVVSALNDSADGKSAVVSTANSGVFSIVKKSTGADEPVEGSLIITEPNGGETYKVGDIISIDWESTMPRNTHITVALFNKEGQFERILFEDSYSHIEHLKWKIPSDLAPGGTLAAYKIGIKCMHGNRACFDQSDDLFTIDGTQNQTAPISVSVRNATYSVKSNGTIEIPFTWTSQSPNGYPFAYLLKSDQDNANPQGGAYASIRMDEFTGETSGKGSSFVNVFRTITSGQYKVVVCDQSTDIRNPVCGASKLINVRTQSQTAPTNQNESGSTLQSASAVEALRAAVAALERVLVDGALQGHQPQLAAVYSSFAQQWPYIAPQYQQPYAQPAQQYNANPFAAPNCPVFTETLQVGSLGEQVTRLQMALYQRGYLLSGDVTNFFDYTTMAGLQNFQLDSGLEPVGFVGPQTRALLNVQEGCFAN